MSALPRIQFLLLLLLSSVSLCGQQPVIVNHDFGAVRIHCASGFAYEWPVDNCAWRYTEQNFNATPGFGWTLSLTASIFYGLAGLTGPNTAFGPPSFEGMPFDQAVFLQGAGSFVSQPVTGFTPGTYVLSFYLGSRYNLDGTQTVEVLMDDHPIGTWPLETGTPFLLRSVTFSVNTPGTHTLKFLGTTYGDHTAFLSDVVITRATHT